MYLGCFQLFGAATNTSYDAHVHIFCRCYISKSRINYFKEGGFLSLVDKDKPFFKLIDSINSFSVHARLFHILAST